MKFYAVLWPFFFVLKYFIDQLDKKLQKTIDKQNAEKKLRDKKRPISVVKSN